MLFFPFPCLLRFFHCLLLLPLCLAAANPETLSSPPARPPNLIVIFADDLGYGDLGCFGAERIATPQLDRLAGEGMLFTDFYSAAPFCSPSRAALLTGRLPARCGLPYVLFPAEHMGLPPEETTLAELLRAGGYATACIGKWHLGWDAPFRPTNQGFAEFFGLPYSNDSVEWKFGEGFFAVDGLEPLPLVENHTVVEAPVDQSTLTQRYTDRALDFITRSRDRPFFLYLAHTMPHIPQYASPAYQGNSADGLYGDAVEEIDGSTGQILQTLRSLGLDRNTLVLFTSDNGANLRNRLGNGQKKFPGRSWGGNNGPLRGAKGSTWEGGVRVPALAWWPGQIPAGTIMRAPVSTLDLFPTMASLAGLPLDPACALDGQDISSLLRSGLPQTENRALYHYFGYQLQAVRQGSWKLFLPLDSYPELRAPSLWFDHRPGLYELQHRLKAQPSLYNLALDPGEQRDLAALYPAIVDRLRRQALAFDAALFADYRPILILPGPPPPTPGQLRQPSENLDTWKTANR